MFPTGLQRLDKFLSGGISGGIITDIFGSSSTGKTQLLFQLSANAIMRNNKILYIDTTGNFRPERILGFKDMHYNLLDRIAVLRVRNTHEQMKSLQDSNFDLILIDSVTDLFSYEYSEKIFDRNNLFMQYMHALSSHAIDRKIPIVVTNTIRQIDDIEIENMKYVIDPFTHVKIRLYKDDTNLLGTATWLQNSLDFSFEITLDGLTDTVESI